MRAGSRAPSLAPTRRRSAVILAGLAFLATWTPLVVDTAQSRDLTASERQRLAQAVRSFEAAMSAKQMDKVAGVLPPRMVARLAEQLGLKPGEVRGRMGKVMGEALDQIKLVSFGMDVAAAQEKELANGEPYVLIPTRTTMAPATGKIEVSSNTLALMEGGRWYLVDVSDPSRAARFVQVYPKFAGVEFGGKTTKVVP